MSLLAKMVWDFHMILVGQLSNPDDEAVFQDDLYKIIDPKTTKAIVAATHHPYSNMHEIVTSVDCLTIHF